MMLFETVIKAFAGVVLISQRSIGASWKSQRCNSAIGGVSDTNALCTALALLVPCQWLHAGCTRNLCRPRTTSLVCWESVDVTLRHSSGAISPLERPPLQRGSSASAGAISTASGACTGSIPGHRATLQALLLLPANTTLSAYCCCRCTTCAQHAPPHQQPLHAGLIMLLQALQESSQAQHVPAAYVPAALAREGSCQAVRSSSSSSGPPAVKAYTQRMLTSAATAAAAAAPPAYL